jgi:hypothetical protein
MVGLSKIAKRRFRQDRCLHSEIVCLVLLRVCGMSGQNESCKAKDWMAWMIYNKKFNVSR